MLCVFLFNITNLKNKGTKSPTSKFFLATKAFPKVDDSDVFFGSDGCAKVWHWMKLRPGSDNGECCMSVTSIKKNTKGVTNKLPQSVYMYINNIAIYRGMRIDTDMCVFSVYMHYMY